MKLTVVAVLALLAVSMAKPIEDETSWVEIDWSNVVPAAEFPGFWDDKDFGPAFYQNDQTRAGRIVGGEIVVPHTHPYQVGLVMNRVGGNTMCGGSIISTRTILTAAHCPIGSISTTVIMGAHVMNADEPTQHRQLSPASTYRLHPNYNNNNLNNDIATIQLPSVIQFSAQIAIISLVPANAGAFVGELAQVSGWGRINNTPGSGASPILRSTTNAVISNAVCSQTFGGTIIASTLCTTTVNGSGTCHGDSGGPLTVLASGARQQIGVVSFVAAAGCALGHPAGFARVTR